MNSSISKTHVSALSKEERMKLSNLERILLLLPMAGGLIFGLGPFLFGSAVGAAVGFPGNDAFLYRLAGAAAFGYAVALILGIRQRDWAPLRQVVIGTLTFNLASIFAAWSSFWLVIRISCLSDPAIHHFYCNHSVLFNRIVGVERVKAVHPFGMCGS
jgi:hypothetical protein